MAQRGGVLTLYVVHFLLWNCIMKYRLRKILYFSCSFKDNNLFYVMVVVKLWWNLATLGWVLLCQILGEQFVSIVEIVDKHREYKITVGKKPPLLVFISKFLTNRRSSVLPRIILVSNTAKSILSLARLQQNLTCTSVHLPSINQQQ